MPFFRIIITSAIFLLSWQRLGIRRYDEGGTSCRQEPILCHESFDKINNPPVAPLPSRYVVLNCYCIFYKDGYKQKRQLVIIISKYHLLTL
jgi:hypothetical protein